MASKEESGTASKTIHDAFGTTDLYEILQVSSKATQKDIKRAYWKQALKVHPDKNKSEDATKKFQALGVVHSILSDEKKRKAYDDYGSIDDADISEEFEQWFEYFRSLFPPVTTSKIDKFRKEYVDSDEERSDIIKAFVTFKGNMEQVLDNIMFAEDSDEDRFVHIIQEAIDNNDIQTYLPDSGTVPAIKRLTATQKKKRNQKAKREVAEASKIKEDSGGMESLEAMIHSRQASRGKGSFLEDLEAKYAHPTKKSKTKKTKTNDISDAEFEKTKARLGKKNKK